MPELGKVYIINRNVDEEQTSYIHTFTVHGDEPCSKLPHHTAQQWMHRKTQDKLTAGSFTATKPAMKQLLLLFHAC